jgi:hypothetical protein
MSLDLTLKKMQMTEVFWQNITHNLVPMAKESGLYDCLWRPGENGIKKAADMISPLKAGLGRLKSNPKKFVKLNPANGWGSYEGFVEAVESILEACEENPSSKVSASV